MQQLPSSNLGTSYVKCLLLYDTVCDCEWLRAVVLKDRYKRIPSDRPSLSLLAFVATCKSAQTEDQDRRWCSLRQGLLDGIRIPSLVDNLQRFALQSFAHTLSLVGRNCEKELNALLEKPLASFHAKIQRIEKASNPQRFDARIAANSMRFRFAATSESHFEAMFLHE